MRVILFVDWYPTRFAPLNGIFVRRHAQAIARMHEVGVVKVYGDPDLVPVQSAWVERGHGFPEIYVAFRKSTLPVLGKLLNAWRFFRGWRRGAAEYRRTIGEPEMVHGYILPRGALQAWAFARENKLPYVLSEQWTGFQTDDFAQLPWLRRSLMRFCMARAAAITVGSRALRDGMLPHSRQRNFVVTPNICFPVTRAEKTPFVLSPDEKHLLTVGVWDYWKNISGLLRAFRRALDQRPDLHLHLVGEHEGRPALQQLAAELGIPAEKATFYGSLPNPQVMDLMARCDVYITNSMAESFSIATIEATIMGKPVIATRCGGPEDFVVPEIGLLIPVADDGALSRAILQLAETHGDYPPEKLTEYARSRFSEEAVARVFDEMYRQAHAR
jgi:glycosyltransferase involved in cell wall biosynthesis